MASPTSGIFGSGKFGQFRFGIGYIEEVASESLSSIEYQGSPLTIAVIENVSESESVAILISISITETLAEYEDVVESGITNVVVGETLAIGEALNFVYITKPTDSLGFAESTYTLYSARTTESLSFTESTYQAYSASVDENLAFVEFVSFGSVVCIHLHCNLKGSGIFDCTLDTPKMVYLDCDLITPKATAFDCEFKC